jgi:hypothetical protein
MHQDSRTSSSCAKCVMSTTAVMGAERSAVWLLMLLGCGVLQLCSVHHQFWTVRLMHVLSHVLLHLLLHVLCPAGSTTCTCWMTRSRQCWAACR